MVFARPVRCFDPTESTTVMPDNAPAGLVTRNRLAEKKLVCCFVIDFDGLADRPWPSSANGGLVRWLPGLTGPIGNLWASNGNRIDPAGSIFGPSPDRCSGHLVTLGQAIKPLREFGGQSFAIFLPLSLLSSPGHHRFRIIAMNRCRKTACTVVSVRPQPVRTIGLSAGVFREPLHGRRRNTTLLQHPSHL